MESTKDKGNKAYGAGKLQEAIAAWTEVRMYDYEYHYTLLHSVCTLTCDKASVRILVSALDQHGNALHHTLCMKSLQCNVATKSLHALASNSLLLARPRGQALNVSREYIRCSEMLHCNAHWRQCCC
jgi:hypothetical protein